MRALLILVLGLLCLAMTACPSGGDKGAPASANPANNPPPAEGS